MIEERTIVIGVDDEEAYIDTIQDALQGKYDFRPFKEASAALKAVKELKPTLREGQKVVIVTDYKMPDMDGPQFLQALRDNKLDFSTVMISATPEQEVMSRMHALNVKADIFVKKPITNAHSFCGAIENALTKHVQRSSAPFSLSEGGRGAKVEDFMMRGG